MNELAVEHAARRAGSQAYQTAEDARREAILEICTPATSAFPAAKAQAFDNLLELSMTGLSCRFANFRGDLLRKYNLLEKVALSVRHNQLVVLLLFVECKSC